MADIEKKIERAVQGSESDHFNIPDQSHLSSHQHNDISLKLANDIINMIDESDDLFEGFYRVKAWLYNKI